MSAVKRIRPASHLALVEGMRGFRLIVTPGRGETFGVRLEETYGKNGGRITVPVTTVLLARTALFRKRMAGDDVPAEVSSRR